MVVCGLNQVEINDNKYKKKKDIRNLAICKKCTGVLFFHPNCLLGRHSAKTDIFSFPSSVVLSSTAPSGAIDRDTERKLLVGSRATFIAQLLCLANSF